MVETAADLHGSQLAVEPHGPRRVGGDLAGVLLSSLAASICKANDNVSASELCGGSSRAPGQASPRRPEEQLEGEDDSEEMGREKGKPCWNKKEELTALKRGGFGPVTYKRTDLKRNMLARFCPRGPRKKLNRAPTL